MSILVTGAAGFIGSHVVDRLLAEGWSVVGLDSFDPFYDRSIKERNLQGARAHEAFTEIEGDIRLPATFEDLPDDISHVVHLAALAGVRPSIADPRRYQAVNVGGTNELLEWARRRGVRNVVFASSSSVYGNTPTVPFAEDADVRHPISPYAATKVAGELLCHTYHHLYGISVVALRLFTVYGPRQRPDLAIHKFARLLREGRPIPMYGDGSTERDYTYIDDILNGIIRSVELTERSDAPVFEVINLGENQTVSLRVMIDVLADEMGVEPTIEQLPMQPGDVTRTYADVSKARRLLGYEPSTEFRRGIRQFLAWFEVQAVI